MNSLLMLDVWCRECGRKWLTPSSSVDGDLHVFHDRRLEKNVVLNVYEDAFFDQVLNLIEEICGAGSVRTGVVTNIHAVLSLLADRDETGGEFNILANMSCPICGAERLAYRPTDPPTFSTEELPALRHTHWSALSDVARTAEVKMALGLARLDASK